MKDCSTMFQSGNLRGGGIENRENPGFSDPVGAVVPIGPKTRCEAPSKRVSIHKDNFGPDSIKGFPVSFTNKGTWCQRLKTRFLESPAARGGTNIVEYLGIAADEPGRFGQLNERKRAPLVEFGIEEGLCGLYCQYEGILAPSYARTTRSYGQSC